MLINLRNALMSGQKTAPSFIGTVFTCLITAEHMSMGFELVSIGSWATDGVIVDWGDGAVETITNTGNVTHTYGATGTYIVRVSDDISALRLWRSTSEPAFQFVCTKFTCTSRHRIDLGANAFRLSVVERIELPEDYFFGNNGNATFYNARALAIIISRCPTPPQLNTNAWSNNTALTGIYVPDASVEAYKSAAGWSSKSSIILPLNTLP